MIILRKISLFQFRNYAESVYSIDFPLLCITGKNGSGKTNFLDAIYTLCYTKSYFSATVQPTVMQGTEGYRIEGHFDQNEKVEKVVCRYKNAKKVISCSGFVYEKQTDHIGKYAAVMIAPDDIEIINDGSELRRKFMDGILCQCDKSYFEALLQYQKVLQQRNAWLKMYQQNTASADNDLLKYYDTLLGQNGTYIFEKRTSFLLEFMPLLQKNYNQLSGANEIASIEYQSDLNKNNLAQLLNDHLQQDLRYQRTLRGVHKDDLVFQLDDLAIKNYGSQGQKKSYLFSMKLAQYEYLKSKMNISPILLLDDIFEKLDQQRMEALLKIIRSNIFGQVVLTDTHESRVREAFGSENKIEFIRL